MSVATKRDPGSFAVDATAIGPGITPKTLAEAVRPDVIFLAAQFQQHPDIAKALPNWQRKIIVDVTNAYGAPDEELDGQPSARIVEQAFTDGKLVVFLTSDNGGAAEEVATLTGNLGSRHIDPASVRAEVEAAGLMLDEESTLLANKEDRHAITVFYPAIRGKTDRFAYRFVKT